MKWLILKRAPIAPLADRDSAGQQLYPHEDTFCTEVKDHIGAIIFSQ
jgi:hypothetical protein